MNSMYLAFSVVFPLFTLMAFGYFLRWIKLFDEKFLEQLNNLCFKTFLPIILFMNIYNSDFNGDFKIGLIAFTLISIVVTCILLMLLIPIFVKKDTNRGVVIQGMFRSNFILFGVPMTASLYGSDNISVTTILLAFVIFAFNILAVIVLETYSSKKTGFATILKGVIKNPLIIGATIGFYFMITGLKLPSLLENTISDISKIATPLSLIVLGGSFKFANLFNDIKLLSFSVLGKLVLIPGIILPIAILLGFRTVELASLLAVFASPTAVSSYTMAQSAKIANHELAGQIVVIGSILSVLTIFLWITVLSKLGFL